MLIYVSGAYNAENDELIQANIEKAGKVAGDLWNLGHAVICPHTNTSQFLVPVNENVGWEDFLKADETMISVCDCLVMVPGWENSKGAIRERDYALYLGMTCWEYPRVPALHPTEIKSPVQVRAFREFCGFMYRLHMDKNADYSPANIMGTGEIGVGVRLWDKVTRLLNLYGYDIKIAEPAKLGTPKVAKNESIDDTLSDIAVYGIIGRLLRQGKWGK